MESKEKIEIKDAHAQLELALEFYHKDKINKRIAFLAIAKAFEVLVEYAWKHLKELVEAEGMEANSPREAFRQAAVIGIIKKPEAWLECLVARNYSVHNYFGVSEEAYVKVAGTFSNLVHRDLLR